VAGCCVLCYDYTLGGLPNCRTDGTVYIRLAAGEVTPSYEVPTHTWTLPSILSPLAVLWWIVFRSPHWVGLWVAWLSIEDT
jgi:hypothetical protein